MDELPHHMEPDLLMYGVGSAMLFFLAAIWCAATFFLLFGL